MGAQHSNTFSDTLVLYRDPNVLQVIFSWLDPTSLAVAACVCKKWRIGARTVWAKKTDKYRRMLVDVFSGRPELPYLLDKAQRFETVLADVIGNVRLLRWLTRNLVGPLPSRPTNLRARACALAAEHGMIDTLRWLHATYATPPYGRSQLFRKDACSAAARAGHLKILRWLRMCGWPWNKKECLCLATDRGHTAVAAWISKQ